MTNTTKQTEAISTERALKLALEALESCDAAHITDGGRQWYDEKLVDKAVEAIEKALTSVPDWASEAKEQPAQQKLVPYEPSIDMQEQGSIASGYDLSQARAKKVYQAMIDMHDVMMEREPTDEWFRLQAGYPEQPAPATELREQEPVAWMHWLHGPVRLFFNKDEAQMELERLNREYPVDVGSRKMRPLVFCDTSPPAQRKPWVGLTDEDIKEAEWLLSAIKQYEAYTLDELLTVDGVDAFARAIEAKLKEKNT